jgi:hypothetical protein
MDKAIIGKQIFASTRSKAETKHDVTDKTARGIIEKEVEKRDVKTARLRQARLEMEAAEAARALAEGPKRAAVRGKKPAARKTLQQS